MYSKNVDVYLKELNTKATSEITIRQALSELDMWEFETHFSTINYVDSKGHTIRIINDFKTIFSSVRQIPLLKKQMQLYSVKHTFRSNSQKYGQDKEVQFHIFNN